MRNHRYILFILALIVSVSMRGQYNPTNPAEPGVYYTLTLQATPESGGSFNIGSVTTYSEGTIINLRAYTNSNFSFAAWELDGDVYSTSSSISYVMPGRNVTLIAHYNYAPNNPSEPSEPSVPEYSTLSLKESPSGSGYFNINSGNRYEVGTAVSLRAYNNSNFVFRDWTENGVVVSTSSSFQYVIQSGNHELTANYTYNPGNPSEPSEPQFYRKLWLESNPSGGGYFNISSGNEYQAGSSVYLRAYSNQWYSFLNWTIGDSVISTNSSFYYEMPDHEVTLKANYSYDYNPSSPNEPGKPTTEYVNIYGMSEDGVRGQTIIYPVYLENDQEVSGMVIDVRFPTGFIVKTDNIALTGRASGHEISVLDIGENNYRFSLLGDDSFIGDNGKIFEVPVSIPDTAVMGFNYPVILTHGVIHGIDGSLIPVSVRSGNIYVEKISEDGLYARFSYDKLQGRVKFTNLSSDKAVSYFWDFGDGQTSEEKNPLHLFEKSGYYTVTLTVKGEIDTDIAEQTVLINDESSWRVEGMFYLSDEVIGVRYFNSADELFSFIGGAPLAGDVKISVQSGNEFCYSLVNSNKQLIRKIQNSLVDNSYTLSWSKYGTGRNPVFYFGDKEDSFDRNFVDLFVQLGKNMSCEGVELRLWGITLNPAQIDKLSNQLIHSGDKSTPIDLSSISSDLTFTWNLSEIPTGVSGYVASGERIIPAMTIVNESDGSTSLVYNIIGTSGGETFCEFFNTITVTPALVGLFNSLSPGIGAVSESSTVTLTWNKITNAVYDVYLWNAQNSRPSTPVIEGTTELRYTTSNFCQNGRSYKWQIVARNENQTLSSDTMQFAVRSLPDLHVYDLDCSEAVAGKKFTVEWTVRNDGIGSTGDQTWNDYIWIVTDVYGGTQPSGTSTNNSQLLATVKNVKALDSGESYDNHIDITLDERTFGNYYLLVSSDMYSVSDIQWSAVGGSVVNPYIPVQDGTGYRHLYATTTPSYNMVYEQGESTSYSDNFFYKKIEIAVPDIADLQISSINAQVLPNLEPIIGAAQAPLRGDGDYIYDEYNELLYSWEECYVPTPLTAAGLRKSNAWYSGKKIVVSVTVVNKGGEGTKNDFTTVLYMSKSPDHDDTSIIPVASKTHNGSLAPGAETTLYYAFYLPYETYGELYFHAYADINDVVYELANTVNNWGTSEKYDVLLCPGADFIPSNLSVPSSISVASPFDISYSVFNKGTGVPYSNNWQDKIYISKKSDGLDESAVLLETVSQKGSFVSPPMQLPVGGGGYVIITPENYKYQDDNYTKKVSITPRNLSSGTYYIYVVADGNNKVYEHEGENNNVLRSSPITFVQPDIAVELIAVPDDTLMTDGKATMAWKLKNVGLGNINKARIANSFYATVNQTATGGVQFAMVDTVVTIPAGSERTIRTNVTIPKNSNLDGLRYIYVKTNSDNSLREESSENNTSGVLRSWFKYTTEPVVPVVKGANIYVSNLNVSQELIPGQPATVTFTVKNSGDADFGTVDVLNEIFLSNDYRFDSNSAFKCAVTEQKGSISGLKVGKSVTIAMTFTVPEMYGGDKYIHIYLDRANTLKEKNTTDNYARSSVKYKGNLPDLSTTSYSLKDTLLTSENNVLKFTVANNGEWNSGKSFTAVYLSADSKYDYYDQQLANLSVDNLVLGASTEQTVTVNLPDNKAGNWYIIIYANQDNRVLELDRNNNITAIPVVVAQSPLPDLTINTVSTDSVLTSGKPLKIKTTIGNKGSHATRSNKWSDTYYLSSSTVLNTSNDIQLGSKGHVGFLNEKADYNSEVTFTIPSGVQGNYVLFVLTDASDAIVEENENNNSKGIPVFINGSADTPADLQVTSISAPSGIVAGDDISISYKIENIGEFTAAANLHDVIYLSKDDKWDIDDEMIGTVSGNVTIDPGNTLTRRATGRITNIAEGDYYIIIKTNSTRSVAERNTDNNVGVMKSATSLSFKGVTIGSTTSFSTSGYFKLSVPDNYEGKTIGLYLDYPAEASAGLYVTHGQVPSTARKDFASSSLLDNQIEVLIPNAKAGNYYILAQDNAALVNSTGNVFSLNGVSQNNISTPLSMTIREVHFGATTLTIKEGGNGGWVSTDIKGALFDSIMDFRLILDETVIPAEAVTFNGNTRTHVTFNLNNAQIGDYDVVSELPDGTRARLPNGFKVIPGASVNLGAKIDAPSVVRVGSYAPVSVSYANGGNTDCELYDLILVIDNGYLATTIEGLDQHQSVLHLPIDTESDARGYKTIPPGTQKTVNIFMYQTSNTSNITIYLVK